MGDARARRRDFKPAAEELEEGRYAMLWAREVLAGRTPPERRAPCFFDPRHGPSTRDVSWAPPGGRRARPGLRGRRAARRPRRPPHTRYVERDGERVPFYEAGPAFAPFYSGFFPGLLIGSMVAGGWDNPTPSDYSGSERLAAAATSAAGAGETSAGAAGATSVAAASGRGRVGAPGRAARAGVPRTAPRVAPCAASRSLVRARSRSRRTRRRRLRRREALRGDPVT